MNDSSGIAIANENSTKTFGIIAIVFGVLTMLAPGFIGASIALMLGPLVLVIGIMRVYWAFKTGVVGRGLLMFALGALTILCGLALLGDLLLAASLMTIMLAVYFVVDGIAEIAAGLTRIGSGGALLLIGGVISIMLGGMIWKQFPLSGIWATGVLVGIKLFFIGVIMVTGGSAANAPAKA